MLKPMAGEGARDHQFLRNFLIYSNKLAYLQLIEILVYRSNVPKTHGQGYFNLSKNLEKYLGLNSFLEAATFLKII